MHSLDHHKGFIYQVGTASSHSKVVCLLKGEPSFNFVLIVIVNSYPSLSFVYFGILEKLHLFLNSD